MYVYVLVYCSHVKTVPLCSKKHFNSCKPMKYQTFAINYQTMLCNLKRFKAKNPSKKNETALRVPISNVFFYCDISGIIYYNLDEGSVTKH